MIRNLSRKLFAVLTPLVLLFVTLSGPSLAALSYDVVVAGGGAGGVGAAIAAARLGVRVALLEETDWLGGQMTAAAVSTMDDLSGNRSGIYGEFYGQVALHYFLKGKSVSTCYWDGGTMAFEPSVGRSILASMAAKASERASSGGRKGTLDIFYFSKITGVKREGPAVRKVTADLGGHKTDINCAVLIDATELGDVIPLARARYRAGNSQSPNIGEEGRIQDITWLAVIKKYPGGIPPSLRISTPPPGYDRYAPAFRKIVAAGGNSFRDYPLKLPVDFATHNGYRGLPDSSNPESYNAATPEGWEATTKTGVNWANDYPGAEKWEGRSGLPVAYIEDLEFRRRADGEAIIKTLCFLYYIQHELGEPWSVADDEFLSPLPGELTRGILGDEYAEVLRRLPLIPYVREIRRIVGLETPASAAVRRNSESYTDGREGREIPTALAIGGYILDLHGADEDENLEAELGERASSIKTDMPRGPFQVPFGAFIPVEVDGFLPAEKNLSMSRLVSGALRLQPISMHTGQAAGTLAALAVLEDQPPRKIDPRLVQRHLLEAGSALSLCEYSDVPQDHPFWPGVQMANLYGWLAPEELPSSPSAKIDDIYNNKVVVARLFGRDKGVFGVDTPLTGQETEMLLRKAFEGEENSPLLLFPEGGTDGFVARKDFADALARALGYGPEGKEWPSRFADIEASSHFFGPVHYLAENGVLDRAAPGGVFLPDSFISRGAAADMVMRAVTIRKGEKQS